MYIYLTFWPWHLTFSPPSDLSLHRSISSPWEIRAWQRCVKEQHKLTRAQEQRVPSLRRVLEPLRDRGILKALGLRRALAGVGHVAEVALDFTAQHGVLCDEDLMEMIHHGRDCFVVVVCVVVCWLGALNASSLGIEAPSGLITNIVSFSVSLCWHILILNEKKVIR